MGEVPHCPDCNRADIVDVRNGSYTYWCHSCDHVIRPDDVTDGPWVDMVADRMFVDAETTTMNATDVTFSEACCCDYCLRVRDRVVDVEQMRRDVQQNIVDKFAE